MGQITIKTAGSFGITERTFSAMEHGHADAVAQAIEFLVAQMLPEATAQDHKLHNQAAKPTQGWDRFNRG